MTFLSQLSEVRCRTPLRQYSVSVEMTMLSGLRGSRAKARRVLRLPVLWHRKCRRPVMLYHPGGGRVVTYANGVEKNAMALSIHSDKRASFLTGIATVVSSTGAVIHLCVAHRTSELLIKTYYCRRISRSMCMHLTAFVSISHTGIWATLTQSSQSLVSLLYRAIFWSIPCYRLQCPSHLVVNDL